MRPFKPLPHGKRWPIPDDRQTDVDDPLLSQKKIPHPFPNSLLSRDVEDEVLAPRYTSSVNLLPRVGSREVGVSLRSKVAVEPVTGGDRVMSPGILGVAGEAVVGDMV